MKLGLSLPLYNEAPLVEAVVTRLLEATEGIELTVALVDNGSTDGTGAIVDRLASDARCVAVHHATNQGYGGGILSGIEALADADVLGWAWGDGQVDPGVIPELFEACRAGAPLAKARRVRRLDGWRRRVVTAAYSAVMRSLGVRTPDVNGCPKLLRREAFEALAPRSRDWFLDPEVVIGAEARGWRVAEVPVVMAPRPAGRSKVRAATVAEFALNLARWRVSGGR